MTGNAAALQKKEKMLGTSFFRSIDSQLGGQRHFRSSIALVLGARAYDRLVSLATSKIKNAGRTDSEDKQNLFCRRPQARWPFSVDLV